MKIRPVGAEFVPCGRAGGQTDKRDNAYSRVSQFCERIRKELHHFTSRLIEVLRTEVTSRTFSLICRPSSVLVRSFFQHFMTSVLRT